MTTNQLPIIDKTENNDLSVEYWFLCYEIVTNIILECDKSLIICEEILS